MCGIFGFIATAGSACDRTAVPRLLEDLFRLSEPRGREASGLVVAADGEARVFKRAMAPSQMLRTPDYKGFLDGILDRAACDADGRLATPVAAIGHCRLVTNGTEVVPGNNQPIVVEHTVGIHNGIVTNDAELWRRHGELERRFDSDSEILFTLIDRHLDDAGDMETAVVRTFAEITGSASIAFLRDDARALTLATNTGSLYYAHLADAGMFVFSSERYILASFLGRNAALANGAGNGSVRHLASGEACIAGFADGRPHVFALGTAAAGGAPRAAAERAAPIAIRDVSSRLPELRRCTRCILPASYPFIAFDADGVCNYCRDHDPIRPKGRDALERILERHRRTDGEPDCIVAFSGGRDSSYGLHLVKTELGMTPIAYSFDWGMVTDIARRNQARICGALGVEHVMRAADIPTKRRYIRKNINAWLRRPHLGMVPLFMAGDKFFYQIGRELRRELGIDLVIFCAGNELERTDFKGGFAGIRENRHGQRLFAFSMWNKVRIAAFYASQYLLNPAYLNESFLDSVRAFATSFVRRDDFLYLYHYLPWDEATINRTLKDEYGWETASHTENTWRIGDGYTAFINHIYVSVAGFSEFDAFRSNQVREGLLSRDEALGLVARDNEPHLDTLYEFAQQTGLNLAEVLTRISAIPKLY